MIEPRIRRSLATVQLPGIPREEVYVQVLGADATV